MESSGMGPAMDGGAARVGTLTKEGNERLLPQLQGRSEHGCIRKIAWQGHFQQRLV